MKQYIKGKKIINATEKAYKVIYKDQGYVPYEEKSSKKKEKADN